MLWLSTVTSPMTLTLDFQGEILKMLYLRNGMADWLGMKGMWVDRMFDPCCDFQRSPQPWPWSRIFKVKFLIAIDRNAMVPPLRTQAIWVDRLLHLLCGFQLWLWPWIFKVKFWLCCISGMRGPIDMERKGMPVDRMFDSHFDFKLWPHP